MTGETERQRYAIAPQMRVYDQLPMVLAPYVSTTSRPDFRSEVVNTDDLGFRVSHGPSGPIDTQTWWHQRHRGLVIGNSFAFGVGATADQHTLASVLNSLTPYSFLNLGIRAANSTQELIASIPFLDSVELVVVCSGINNLVVGLQSLGKNALFGPLFAESDFEELAACSISDLAAIARSRLDRVGWHLLLREVSSRMLKKLLRTRKRSAHAESGTAGQAPISDRDLKSVPEEALKRQRRDLSIMAKALSPHARLIFAAQPFADVSCKHLSPEEGRLFELLDGMQGVHWQILKTSLGKFWPSYVTELRAMCSNDGIAFLDLNAVEFVGWSYVDRAHMTDDGYMQTARRIAEAIN